MPPKITQILILLSLLVIVHVAAVAQSNSGNLQFRTANGLAVNVHQGLISVNNRHLYHLDDESIIYASMACASLIRASYHHAWNYFYENKE